MAGGDARRECGGFVCAGEPTQRGGPQGKIGGGKRRAPGPCWFCVLVVLRRAGGRRRNTLDQRVPRDAGPCALRHLSAECGSASPKTAGGVELEGCRCRGVEGSGGRECVP